MKRYLLILIIIYGINYVALSQSWYNNNWNYRKAITINSSQVNGSTHSNFPVYVSLVSDAGLAAHAMSNGYDILFTTSDGITKIPHEREKYNAGSLTAWVNVPSISSSANTIIYMYYGNLAATDQQQASNTWSNNYAGVYHLDEPGVGTAGEYKDSRGTNHGQMLEQNVMRGAFTMAGTSGNNYCYENFSGVASYTIVAGDYLVYDIYWTSANDMIAIDLISNNAGALRDKGATDQNGLGAHPSSGLSAYALNKWYHRIIPLSGFVGGVLTNYVLACEYDLTGTKTAYIDNVLIMNGGTVKRIIHTSNGSVAHTNLLNNPATNTVSFTNVNNPSTPSLAGKIENSVNGDGFRYINYGARATNLTDNFTLEAWVNPSTLNQYYGIALYNGNDAGGYGFGMAGNALYGLYGGVAWIPTAYNFTKNNWQHIVMKRTSGTTSFMVNGITYAVTSGGASVPIAPNNRLTIANMLDASNNPIRFFMGLVDEVRISTTARSNEWLITQYNNINNPTAFITAGTEQNGLNAGVIGSAQTLCYNSTPAQLTFTTPASGGSGIYNYQWYNQQGLISNATNNTYQPAALTSSNSYYCVVSSSGYGSKTSNTVNITIYSILTSGTISSNQSICYGVTPQTLTQTSATGGTGAYTYQWYNSGGSLGSTGTSQNYAFSSGLTSDESYYCVVTSGSCGSVTTNTVTINVQNDLVSGTISGANSLCRGESGKIYSIPAVNGATTYIWSLPTGATITSGQNTNSITVSYSLSALSGNINVYASTGLCNGPVSNNFAVTVNHLPAITNASTKSICSGNSTNIGITSSIPSTYTWTVTSVTGNITGSSDGSGSTIDQILSNPSNSTAGTVAYEITPVSAAGCTGVAFTITVTVNPIPEVTNLSSYSVCSGLSPAINLTATAASNFSWTIGTITGSITGASASSGSVINQVLNNPSNTDAGTIEYLVTPTSTAGSCQGSAKSIIVTVNPKPALTNNLNSTICSGNGTGINLSSSIPSSFSWSLGTITGGITGASAGTGGTINQTLTNPSNTTAGNVPYIITPVSNSSSCQGNAYTITVSVNPAPVMTNASTKIICSNTSTNISLTSSIASTYTWSYSQLTGNTTGGGSGSGNTINQTLINTSNSAASSVEYTITPVSSAGCTGAAFSITVTVNPTPEVTNLTSYNVCSGLSPAINLTATAASNFSWTIGTITGGITGASASSGSVINQVLNNPSNTDAGTIEYLVTPTSTAGSCQGSAKSIIVTVNPKPALTNNLNSTICSGNGTGINLSSSIPSSFSWSLGTITGGITGASAGTGGTINQTLTNPSNTTAGNVPYIITPVSNSSSCQGNAYTITVSVNPAPVMTNASTKIICSNTSTNISLTSSIASTYTWSYSQLTGNTTGGGSGSGNTINQTLINTSNSAVSSVEYTITPISAAGCTGTAFSITVTVNPTPEVTSSSTYSICSNLSPAINLTSSVPSSFSWTTGTITGGITGASASNGNIINQVLTNPNTSTDGTVEYLVTPTSTTGLCSGAAFPITVEVKYIPTSVISGSTTMCKGQSAVLNITLTGVSPWSLTYTDGTTPVTINNITATSHNITVNPSNTKNYTVTALSDGRCTSIASGRTGNANITVNANCQVITLTEAPQLTAVISGSNTICVGGSTEITVNITGGTAPYKVFYNSVEYTGSSPIKFNASPSVTTTLNNTNVTVSDVNNCSSITGGSALITVNQDATINLSSAPETSNQSICINTAIVPITYAIGGAGTGASVTAGSLPAGLTGAYSNGTFTISGTATQGGTFNYTIGSSGSLCVNPTASGTITVYMLSATAGNITGQTTVCQGVSNIVYSVPVITNATGYNWSVPTGAEIIAGDNTNTITVNYSTTAVSGVINVYGSDGSCNGSPSPDLDITVNTLPIHKNLSSASNICVGTETNIVVTNSESGVSYQLRNNAGNVNINTGVNGTGSDINLATGILNNTTTFNVFATNTSTLCARQMNGLVTVTTDARPNAIITNNNQTICTGSGFTTMVLSTSPVLSGTTYSWSRDKVSEITGISGTGTGNINGTVLTNTTTSPVTITFSITPTGPSTTFCEGNVITAQLTVNASATANAGTAQTVCAGGTVNLSGSIGGSATSATWTAASGTFSNANSLTSSYTPSISTGTVTLTLTTNDPDGAGPCSAATSQVVITVQPVIANNTISSAQSICSGTAPAALTGGLPTGGSGAYTYLWEKSTEGASSGFSAATGTNNTQNYTAGILTENTWYRRIVTSGQCSSASTSLMITVNALPTISSVSANPSGEICATQTTTLTANGVSGYNTTTTWYTGAGGTGNNLGTGNTLVVGPGQTYYARVSNLCTAAEQSITIGLNTQAPDAFNVNDISVNNSPNNGCYGAGNFDIPGLTDNCAGEVAGEINRLPLPSNLKLWVKADAGVVMDANGKVAQWKDISGNGNDFRQNTFTNRPSKINSSASFNNESCISFNTTSYLTNIKNLDGSANSAYTIFTISRQNGGTNARLISSASTNWLLGYWGNSKNQAFCMGWISVAGTPAADAGTHMYVLSSNSITASGTHLYDNGTLLVSGTAGTPNGPGVLQLNGWNNGLNEMSTGEVAEIIYYNTVLTAAQRQIVEGYLAYKYNLQVPIASMKAYQTYIAGTTGVNFLATDQSGNKTTSTANVIVNPYPGPSINTSPNPVCANGTINVSLSGMAPAGRYLNCATTNDYLRVGTSVSTSNLAVGDNWTIETWFKYPLPANSNWNTFIRGINYHHIIVSQNATGGVANLGVYKNGFFGCGYNFNSNPLTTGWHHLAATGSNGTTSFYIDGVFVGKAQSQATDNIVALGNFQSGGQYAGPMDEVRIWNTVLPQNIISNYQTQGITNSHPYWNNLVAYYKLDGNGVNSATGSSACSGCNGTLVSSATYNTPTAFYTYNISNNIGGTLSPASPSTSETYTISNPVNDNSTISVIAVANSCNSTTSISTTQSITPIPIITNASTMTICSGSSPNLTLTSTLPATYSWTIASTTGGITGASAGSGNVINQVLNNPSNTTAGTVVYTITPTPISGTCTGNPYNITVTVNPKPAITSASTLSICSGKNTAFSLTSSIPSSYGWTIGTITNSINGATAGTGSVIDQYLFNPSQTTAGTVQYLITPVSAGNCAGNTSTLTVTVKPTPNVVITKNYCGPAGKVELTSNAASTNLWSTGETTQVINVDLAGIYTLTVTNSFGCSALNATTVAIELVTNGSFEAGNTGFITAYTNNQALYTGGTTGLMLEGTYAVGTNANLHHPIFYGTDHTTGNGKFMIINGSASTTPIVVWAQNINIQPYTDYYFSAFAMSLNQVGNTYAELRFAVNGVQVGTTANLSPGATTTAGPFYWSRFYGTWNSGPLTTATLSIMDLNNSAGGNDFAIDDVSASTLTPIAFNVSPLGGGNAVCQGNTFTLSSNVSGITSPYTYQWSGPNSYTSTQADITLTNATPAMSGNYRLTVTDANGCASRATVNVIVNPTPTVDANVSASPICYGNSINLTSSANTYTNILYSEKFNGVSNNWTKTNTSAGGTVANASWTLVPSGHTYSGVTFVNADGTQFYFSNSAAQAGTTTATILRSPAINTNGYTDLFLEFYHYYRFGNNESAKVEFSTDGTNWVTGATYTSTQGTSSNFVQTIIDVSAYINRPTFYIRFNYNATNDFYWAIDNVILTGQSTIYNYSWSSNPAGFTSTQKNPSNIVPLTTTTYTVSYTIPSNGCASTQTASVVVKALPAITSQPVAPPAVCANTFSTSTFNVTATGEGPLSYQWQEFRSSWNNITDGGNYAGSNTSGLVITNPASTMNGYRYRCIVSGNCAPAATSDFVVFTVKSPSTAATGVNITNNNACAGTAKVLTPIGGSLGTNASWVWYNDINCTPPAAFTGVSYTVTPPVTKQYWLRAEGDCNTTTSVMATVGVTNPPTSVVVNPVNPSGCIGDIVSFSATASGATSYQWKKNGTNISNQTSNTLTINSLSINDFGTYTCVALNMCGSEQSSSTILNSGSPFIIIQPQTVSTCNGTNAIFSIKQWNQNNNSYTLNWYENGNVIENGGVYTISTDGQNSSLFISNADGLTGNKYYCVITGNDCGANSSVTSNEVTLDVSVTGVAPATPGAISGLANACNLSTGNVYSISPVYDASSYTWTVPYDATITAGQGTTSITVTFGSTSGNIGVTANNACGISAASTKSININSLPIQPGVITINNNNPVCPGASNIPISINPVPGIVFYYNWQLPSGTTVTSGNQTNEITVQLGSTEGNILVSTVNACGSSAAQQILLDFPPIPSQPGSITGLSTVCNGGLATYSIAPVLNATGYTWTVPQGANIINGNNTPNITVTMGTLSGDVEVTADYSCGSSSASEKPVTVKLTPSKPGSISSNKTFYCSGTEATFSISSVAEATSYLWNVPTGCTITSGQGSTSITVTLGNTSGVVNVSAMNECGTSPANSLSININSIPAQPGIISGNLNNCINDNNVNYFVSPVSNATTYSWSGFPSDAVLSNENTNNIIADFGTTMGAFTISVSSGNECGNSLPSSLAINISSAPNQPSIITGNSPVCSGDEDVVFSINNNTSGEPVTFYSWSVPSGIIIKSGIGSTSIVTDIETTATPKAYTISVTADNTCGSSTASTKTINVLTQPVFTINNSDVTVMSPRTANFSVSASGSNLSYRWYEDKNDGNGFIALTNGGKYSGTTTKDLFISNTTTGMDGYKYQCIISGSCGQIISNTGILTVTPECYAAEIISQPVSAIKCSGESVTFSVEVTGSNPFSYRWYKNGVILGGQVNNDLVFNNVIPGNAGNYKVVISNCAGSITSTTVNLSVSTIPAQPGLISGKNPVCKNETGVTYSIAAVAGASTYDWHLPSDATITNGNGTTEITADFNILSGNVSVSASNQCGSSAERIKNIDVLGIPTNLSGISGSAEICSGDTKTYSINSVPNATGYSWTVPSTATIIAGQNTNSITITTNNSNVSVEQISVIVSNICGSSTPQTLAINSTKLPEKPSSIIGLSNVCATTSNAVYSVPTVEGALGYIWSVPADANINSGQGTNSITVTFGELSGNISVYAENNCGQSATEALFINVTNSPPAQPTAITGANTLCSGSIGIPYSIPLVPNALNYTWTVPTGATISNGQNTNSILVNFGAVTGNISVKANNVCGSSGILEYNVSLYNNPQQPGSISGPVSVCAGNSNVVYSVNEVPGVTNYIWQVPDDAIISSGQNSRTITVNFGSMSDNISVSSSNVCGTSPSSNLAVTVNAPVTILNNPGNVTQMDGSAAIINLTATGSGISYKWQEDAGFGFTDLQNGGKYTGVNTNQLTINVVTLSMNLYKYRCIITGTCNTVTSGTSVLTVTPFCGAVSIYDHPDDNTVCAGANLSLAVSASGTAPFQYQWYKNNTLLEGATNFSYNFNPLRDNDYGTYKVVVTNCNGTNSVTSNPGVLIVNTVPTLIYSPFDATVRNGGSTTFSISAKGNGITYKWQENRGSGWVNINDGGSNPTFSGTNTPILVINNVKTSMSNYKYRCSLLSECNTAIYSNAATLTINASGVPGLWIGVTNHDWTVNTNWDTQVVPDSTTNVVISSSAIHQPIVYNNDVAFCKSLVLTPRASLYVKSGATFNVVEDMNIKADNRGMAAFMNDDTEKINIGGKVNVEIYMAGIGYHYIASPLKGITLLQLNKDYRLIYNGKHYNPDVPMYPFPNLWKIDESHSHNIPYDYNAWLSPSSLNEIMTPMTGYALHLNKSSLTIHYTSNINNLPGINNENSITRSLSRTLVSTDTIHSNVPIDEWGKTDSSGIIYGNGKGNGWHLVGNPYPSPLDWEAVFNNNGIEDGLTSSAAFFKATSDYYGNYGYYSPWIGPTGAFYPSRYISAGSSFFIQNDDINCLPHSITFKNNMRSVSPEALSNEFYKSVKNKHGLPILRLQAINSAEKNMIDETVIFFKDEATNDFDTKYDARKLLNSTPGVPNIFTNFNNSNYSINALKEVTDSLIIPLVCQTEERQKLTFKVETEYLNNYNVYLIDVKKNEYHNLKSGNLLTIYSEAGEKDRFFIKFKLIKTDVEENLDRKDLLIKAYSNNKELIVNYFNPKQEKALVKIFDLTGKVIVEKYAVPGISTIDMKHYNGEVYFVNIVTSSKTYTRKFYINQ